MEHIEGRRIWWGGMIEGLMIARLKRAWCLDLSPKCCGLNAVSEQTPVWIGATAALTPGSPPTHASAICSWNRYAGKEEQISFIVNRFEGKINTKIPPLKFTLFYTSLWTINTFQFRKSTKRDPNGWVGWVPRYQLTGYYHWKRDASLFLQETTHSSWEMLLFSPATGDYYCNEEKRNGRNYSDSFQPCRKIWQTQNVSSNNLVLIMVVTYME